MIPSAGASLSGFQEARITTKDKELKKSAASDLPAANLNSHRSN
jgi:hypothetical protein